MNSFKRSNKTSDYQAMQQQFLEKLHEKGFKGAKIIENHSSHDTHNKRRKEDRELLIVE